MNRRKWVIVADTTTARRLVAAADRVEGYPRRGTDKRGRPVGPESWDGTGPTPLGWTKTASAVRVRDDGTFAIRLPADIADRAVAAGFGTEADRDALTTALASAVERLPEDSR